MKFISRSVVVLLLVISSISLCLTQWIQTNGPYSGEISSFAIAGPKLFVGTWSGGMSLSTNYGGSWSAVNTGLTDTAVVSLVVSDKYLFAGIDCGVWRRPLLEMITSVEARSTDFPTNSRLNQNYPNPFNPTTEIRFSLASRGLVTPKVFDLLGREVATLVNQVMDIGKHRVRWDAERGSSDVYFYRLEVGPFTDTKKLMLLH